MEEVKRVNMGIGELGNPNTEISRSFRWLFEADNLVSHFFKSVNFDYKKKLIKFEYYDVVTKNHNMDALVWASKIQGGLLPDEKMTFTALDGCGNEIYKTGFSGLELLEHTSAFFDYAKSDAATQTIVLSYKTMGISLFEPKTNEVKFDEGKDNWTIQFKDMEGNVLSAEIPVTLKDKPIAEIEETEINFLNAKTWIPGKPVWQTMGVETGIGYMKTVSEAFLQVYQHKKLQIVLNYKKGQRKIETWTLNNASIPCYDTIAKQEKCSFTLRYDSVNYFKI